MTDRLPYKDDDHDSPFVRVPCAICGDYCYPSEDTEATANDVRCAKHQDRAQHPKPV